MSHSETETVSINCVVKDGASTCSPSESAAVNDAVVSIIPAVEGKPGWSVVRGGDGSLASSTIEGGNDAVNSTNPGEQGNGDAGKGGSFWDGFGKWRFDYSWSSGPNT